MGGVLTSQVGGVVTSQVGGVVTSLVGGANVNHSRGLSELKCLWNGFRELPRCKNITE